MATVDRNGKEAPVTTVYVPDLEIPVPTWDDLMRAAYARALDDDERGKVRVKAVQVAADIRRYCDKLQQREQAAARRS